MQVLGEFSKSVDGSKSLNFDVSAGSNCDDQCRYHPRSTADNAVGGCYAVVVESRADRRQLTDKLVRHGKTDPVTIVNAAIVEIGQLTEKRKKLPWFRFSTNGSVPKLSELSERKKTAVISAFRALVKTLSVNGCDRSRIHLPVETADKAREYSELSDVVTIRESVQSVDHSYKPSWGCSFVVGEDIQDGKNITGRRVDAAKQFAKKRLESTGRKTIVCPAVTSGWQKRFSGRPDKILCGQCTACANTNLDVVYPYHGPKLVSLGNSK
jgi:hypothetical protein